MHKPNLPIFGISNTQNESPAVVPASYGSQGNILRYFATISPSGDITTEVLYNLSSSVSHIEPGTSHLRVLRASSHSRSVCGPGTGPLFFFHQFLFSGVTNCTNPGTTNSWNTIMLTHGDRKAHV